MPGEPGGENGGETVSEYNCPKCRCGCMFEEKNRLICLNCGAEVPAFAAKGVKHTHHYHTYTKGSGNKPTCVQPVRPSVRTVGQSRPVTPVASPRPARSVGNGVGDPRKKKKGCGFWLLLYFALFWLLPLLSEIFS